MKTEDEKQTETKEEHDDGGAQSPELADGDDIDMDQVTFSVGKSF